jgi:agmatine deiminase
VHLNVTGPEMGEEVRRLLGAAGIGVEWFGNRESRAGNRESAIGRRESHSAILHAVPTNDAWCRDHGPVFVQRTVSGRREEAIVDWGYNAWGGKYPPFEDDDRVPSLIGAELGIPVFQPGIVMEGGALDVNGRGTLLTTESCLLNPNRNPSLSRDEIEGYLKAYLGVTHVLWLGDGIEGDDTDGHVDDLTRFIDPATVVTVVEDDPADPNHGPLEDNLARLRAMRDQDGRPLKIRTLPMPPPLHHEGQRLPASYANFYIANGVVLLPGYHPATDEIARRTLQECFPTRRVILLDARDLVWGLGAFHCVTQQWPAVEWPTA